MKLRFRRNSLRLRVNRVEVEALDSGTPVEETVCFPGNARLIYVLAPEPALESIVTFQQGVIWIGAPTTQIGEWANSDAVGLYFSLPVRDGDRLEVAIEKDLECIDGPPDERDPHAFPRAVDDRC